MPQLNKDAHLVPTDDDKTDNLVASVLGKDQPNILSFSQRPKEWIFWLLVLIQIYLMKINAIDEN